MTVGRVWVQDVTKKRLCLGSYALLRAPVYIQRHGRGLEAAGILEPPHRIFWKITETAIDPIENTFILSREYAYTCWLCAPCVTIAHQIRMGLGGYGA